MRLWSRILLHWLALVIPLFVGCANEQHRSATSAVEVVATTHQAVTADVASVVVTISGAGISPPIAQTLAVSGGRWAGTISGIPVGNDRLFVLEARDASGSLLFRGERAGVAIVAGPTALVAILMQQQAPPPEFANHTPRILSLVASANRAAPGAKISLSAIGHDVEDGDGVLYRWFAEGGRFSDRNAATTTWTAPQAEGVVTLRLEVRDSLNAFSALTLPIDVSATHAVGSASLSAALNTWPSVSNVTAAPGRIDAGESTRLHARAHDDDGDFLAFSWTAGCAGSFDDPTTATPTFTLAAGASSGSCSLVVEVRDFSSRNGPARGGWNRGTITIQLGAAPPPNVAPTVSGTFQSLLSAQAGDVVSLRIAAHDPEGTAITFAWSSTQGEVVTDGADGSEATWTAPAPFSGSATITAIITDATGVSTTHAFVVTSTSPFIRQLAGTHGSDTSNVTAGEVGSVFRDGTTGKIYFAAGYDRVSAIKEFSDPESFLAGSGARTVALGTQLEGTYHAALGGFLFYAEAQTHDIVKVDAATGAVVARATFAAAARRNSAAYLWGGYSDVGLFADRGQKLWLLYATAGDAPSTILARLDPETLGVMSTFEMPFTKRSLGFAFVANGVVYTGSSPFSPIIDGAFVIAERRWDPTYRNALTARRPMDELPPISGDYITGLSWDPASGDLFELTAGHTLVYPDVTAPAPLGAGLVGYWPFDGDARDASGAGRDLTIHGGAGFAQGVVGSALSLHGDANQYASRALNDVELDLGGAEFTLQIWVNYDSATAEQTLVEKFSTGTGPGWSITPAHDRRMQFYWTESFIDTAHGPGALVPGIWHHVVVVREAGTVRIVYDGEVAATGSIGSIPPSTNPLLVGRRNAADGRAFAVEGRLDELAIWSRALSDGEIAALYAGGNGRRVR